MRCLDDVSLREKTLPAAAAFRAPFSVMLRGVDEGATLTSSVDCVVVVRQDYHDQGN